MYFVFLRYVFIKLGGYVFDIVSLILLIVLFEKNKYFKYN